MSCWVVPGVAADLWGVSIEQVLEAVRLGTVPSKQDYHFVLVDVAPDASALDPMQRNHMTVQPMTFTPVAHEEIDHTAVEEQVNDEHDDNDDGGRLDWKRARQCVQRRRPCAAGG